MNIWSYFRLFFTIADVGILDKYLGVTAIATIEDVGKFDKYNIIKIIGNND